MFDTLVTIVVGGLWLLVGLAFLPFGIAAYMSLL